MSSEEAASMMQQQQQQQEEDQLQEGSSPQPPGSSSPLKPPSSRSSKISFSVDALLSGASTRRSPLHEVEAAKRYLQHQQHQAPTSRELLARLGPFAAAAAAAAARSAPGLLVPKDFSRSAADPEGGRMSPTTRLAELRRELLGGSRKSEEPPEDSEGRGSSSPRLQDSSPAHSEPRSDDEDLNVMDSDEEHERQQQQGKSNPVVVPQPLHPGQVPGRPPAGGGAAGATYMGPAGAWGGSSPGFPHSLAGFAWLPPPPHPHSPHGHLYNPNATSPNGECLPF